MEIRLIETISIVLVYFLLRLIVAKVILKTVERSLMQKRRAKLILKAFSIILAIIFITSLFLIWGVNQSDLVLFLGSFLAILGMAFFAQWSILSNITSGIILFFNHPVKLDDTISIMDKEFNIEGRVSDISLFFVSLKTKEGKQITLPSNILLQKMIMHSKDD